MPSTDWLLSNCFDEVLARAGHRVFLVRTQVELAEVLECEQVDLLIADFRLLDPVPHGPVCLPVIDQTDRSFLPQLQQEYASILRTPGQKESILRTVENALQDFGKASQVWGKGQCTCGRVETVPEGGIAMLRMAVFVTLSLAVLASVSCEDETTNSGVELVTVAGIVRNADTGVPIAGVENSAGRHQVPGRSADRDRRRIRIGGSKGLDTVVSHGRLQCFSRPFVPDDQWRHSTGGCQRRCAGFGDSRVPKHHRRWLGIHCGNRQLPQDARRRQRRHL